jgi:hypothetical protein
MKSSFSDQRKHQRKNMGYLFFNAGIGKGFLAMTQKPDPGSGIVICDYNPSYSGTADRRMAVPG